MFMNLLADAGGYIAIGVVLLLLIAFFVWSFLSQKKKQKAYNETIAAIRPGNKVKTIGGIVGEVVEVNDEEGTFVLKTGDSQGNASFMKFDKQAIYQTDAKPAEAPAAEEGEEQVPEEPFEKAEEGKEVPAETAEAAAQTEEAADEAEKTAEEPQEEAAAEEAPAAKKAPAKKPASKKK